MEDLEDFKLLSERELIKAELMGGRLFLGDLGENENFIDTGCGGVLTIGSSLN